MRFVRCKPPSGYEAMILTPEQAYAIVCNLREPGRILTLFGEGLARVQVGPNNYLDKNYHYGSANSR
jgi:hypothetical protein